MLESGFSREEVETLKAGLIEVTGKAMTRSSGDLENIAILDQRFHEISKAGLEGLDLARILLDDCKRFGTLPFAHLARSGFVAVTFLRSLISRGIITRQEVDDFLNSINTVTRQFELDGAKVARNEMTWEEFVQIYGHLRPGTYDINSPAYFEDPEKYLRHMVAKVETSSPVNNNVWKEEACKKIEVELRANGLPSDITLFQSFLKQAIVGREYSKFVFSRNLSRALDAIKEFGEALGLNRAQLAHISIHDILAVNSGMASSDIAAWLTDRAEEGKEWNSLSQAVELPPVIFESTDFFVFEKPSSEPNYVTNKSITAETVCLSGTKETDPTTLRGKIVIIPQADPGFDWLFGYEIAGLITMYGGANSHMAIRTAEFGLPAAIGIGEKLYEQLVVANVIELDCLGNRVKVIR